MTIDLQQQQQPPTETEHFVPCGVCGRTFFPDVLPRHQVACKKAHKQRKTFNMVKQRVKGTELYAYNKNKVLANGKKTTPQQGWEKDRSEKPVSGPKKSSWREKHQQFINTIKQARGEKIENAGHTLTSSENPDLVKCPHCERRFSENAAERHVPFCKALKIRSKISASDKAKEQLKIRTKYVPPSPLKKSKLKKPSVFTTPEAKAKMEEISERQAQRDAKGSPLSPDAINNEFKTGKIKEMKKLSSSGNKFNTMSKMGSSPSPSGIDSRTTIFGSSESVDGSERSGNMGSGISAGGGGRGARNGSTTSNGSSARSEASRNASSSGSMNSTYGLGVNTFETLDEGLDNNQFASKLSLNSPSKTAANTDTDNTLHSASSSRKSLHKFCYECGTKYPVTEAKFCVECGTRRM
eukprot:Nk52_evm11s259 gene=Nk52_evmTU11s259